MNHTFKAKRSGPKNGKRSFQPSKKKPDQKKGGRGLSVLDPDQLIRKAASSETKAYVSERTIAQLPLSHELKAGLLKKGFERPTEIQDKTLEASLSGQDILGIAQTGTGKTGAFLFPIIEQLKQLRKLRQYALIIVPTRELAAQVLDEFNSMTTGMGLFGACFIGGTNINTDIRNLNRLKHVIIGTPGRLMDLNRRGVLDFGKFSTLVLDEFDRMLDMGFSRDIDQIIERMHNRVQTMLFSATLDKSQQGHIEKILNDPLWVRVSTGDTAGENIEQNVIRLTEGEDKFDALCNLLYQDDFAKVLIFDETKHRVKRLSQKLSAAGFQSGQIQGNMSQGARQGALKAFKEGKIKILVASDVAARGIDVNDISHVINYQMPANYETYIHRIGRTGRAGNFGKALTFTS